MKILLSAQTLMQSGDVPFFLTKALNGLGHEARLISSHDSSFWTTKVFRKLKTRCSLLRHQNHRQIFMREVRHWNPDLVLIYGSNMWFEADALVQMKKNGCKVVLWEENNRFFDGTYFRSLPAFDHVFVLDTYFIPVLRSIGVKNVSHLAACVDLQENFPFPLGEDDPYSCDIGFLGSLYPNRLVFLKAIARQGYRLNLYVNPVYQADQDIGRFVRTDPVLSITKTKVFSNSKISINIQGPKMINAENYRVFEVAACKGLSFSTYKPDLVKSFTPDKEVILFDSVDEFNEKAKYYLTHLEERKQVAEAAYQRVLAEHTYEHRARELLAVLDL